VAVVPQHSADLVPAESITPIVTNSADSSVPGYQFRSRLVTSPRLEAAQ